MYKNFKKYIPLHCCEDSINKSYIKIITAPEIIIEKRDYLYLKYDHNENITIVYDFLYITILDPFEFFKKISINEASYNIGKISEEDFFVLIDGIIKQNFELNIKISTLDYIFSNIFYQIRKDKHELYYLIKTRELMQ